MSLEDRIGAMPVRGGAERSLRIGAWRIALTGLDVDLAEALDARWGSFVGPRTNDEERLELEVRDAGDAAWIPGAFGTGGVYRVEAQDATGRGILSHHFAMARLEAGRRWRCGLTRQDAEPADRAVENALRCLLARAAAEDGGFALHGAAVERGGHAWVFAGPSRAGKSTAVQLSAPARSMGDDYALVLPFGAGWAAPAVPFDNREHPPEAAPTGLVPLAGIAQLAQDPLPGVETLPPVLAVAALFSCLAMPWTHPDLAPVLLEQVRTYVATGRFARLHFRPAPDFWPLLEAAWGQRS